MKTLMKAFLTTTLLSLSVSSLAIENPLATQQLNTPDLSEKKVRLSSFNQLVSYMQGVNAHANANSYNSELILQSIDQNSLNHKKLPEKLVAGR